MYRTNTCGELTKKNIGKQVTLSGWVHNRRDHGGVIFIDLRDMYGLTQVTFNPDTSKVAHKLANSLRSEFVITVTGKVAARPDDMINDKLATGAVEVFVDKLTIISSSKALPFEVNSETDANEDIRLKYRFLDLRRDRMKENLLYRGKVIKFIRDWFYDQGFTEFETPILTASSPEGARDYLVPSRIHAGKFYALPQAPQQYKQMLMMSGFDKYFQIAPCFRDEDPRADRSPGEFYQLDVETSFMTQDEFFDDMEPLWSDLTKEFTNRKMLAKPIPRIPYKQAMLEYGSDKPDLRFDLKIQDVSGLVKGSGFKVFADTVKGGGVVRCIVGTGAAEFPRSALDELVDFAQDAGLKGLAYIIVKKGELKSPIKKFLGDKLTEKIVKQTGAKVGDVIFFGADAKASVVAGALGQLRLELGKRLNVVDESIMGWCWIVDFPMFEWDENNKKVGFGHNPFSMPQGGIDAFKTKDPLDILAYQYDIVCNGVELSSGAVRNYDREVMYKAFGIAGYSKKDVDREFSGMLSAFDYGAPPSCGFAPGIERLLMVLRNEPNIREMTAFPKNGKAEDVLMGAPSEISKQQLKELHIKLDNKK